VITLQGKRINLDQRVFSEADYITLLKLAMDVPENGNVLEIGSFSGNSTMALVDGTEGRNIQIYCIDTWGGEPEMKESPMKEWYENSKVFKQFLSNTSSVTKDPSRIHTIKQDINTVDPDSLPKIDLVFIDGDHRTEQVVRDCLFAQIVSNSTGVIAVHDYRPNNSVELGLQAMHWKWVSYMDSKRGFLTSIWMKQ